MNHFRAHLQSGHVDLRNFKPGDKKRARRRCYYAYAKLGKDDLKPELEPAEKDLWLPGVANEKKVLEIRRKAKEAKEDTAEEKKSNVVEPSRNVVAFENPMFDDPNLEQYGAPDDHAGLYDEPDGEGSGLYDEPGGEGGFLDVQPDDDEDESDTGEVDEDDVYDEPFTEIQTGTGGYLDDEYDEDEDESDSGDDDDDDESSSDDDE